MTARAIVCMLGALALASCRPREAGPPVATNRVTLPPSYRFAPPSITVAVGTKVTWVNSDHFTHAIRLLDDGGAVLKMRPGDSVAFVFSTPGVRRYDCSVHPHDMRGTVVVTAP